MNSFAQTLLATLLGGATTGVFALLAVALTGRWNARAARDADCRREAAQQRQWNRERRLEAYADVLTASDDVMRDVRNLNALIAASGPPGPLEARAALANAVNHCSRVQDRAVLLASPALVPFFFAYAQAVERLVSARGQGNAAETAADTAVRAAYGVLANAIRDELEIDAPASTMSQRRPLP